MWSVPVFIDFDVPMVTFFLTDVFSFENWKNYIFTTSLYF